MRNRDAKRRSLREKIKQKRTFGFFYASLFLCLSAACFSAGCVRVAGTAGYWHTNAEGEAQAKQAGFDTANLVPKGKDQGNITF